MKGRFDRYTKRELALGSLWVAWANLFARDCPASNTGKLLLAHATQKTKYDKAREFAPIGRRSLP